MYHKKEHENVKEVFEREKRRKQKDGQSGTAGPSSGQQLTLRACIQATSGYTSKSCKIQ